MGFFFFAGANFKGFEARRLNVQAGHGNNLGIKTLMGEEGGQKSAFFIYIKKLNVDLNKGPSKGAATSYAVPNPA